MIRPGGAGGAVRATAGAGSGSRPANRGGKMPVLEDFLTTGDFVGAVTLLEFKRRTEDPDATTMAWLAYCAFHLGNYTRAISVYKDMIEAKQGGPDLYLYQAACYFFMRDYEKAEECANLGPDGPLKYRLLFHIEHKLRKEPMVIAFHQKLSGSNKLDQLSVAAMHYYRYHYHEATDIYKKLLLDSRDDVALNVFIAMCYYKLDYYDVSQDILNVYLQSHPTSILAVNLRACNQFKSFNGKMAEAELKVLADRGVSIEESDLLRHNLVVFRNGEGAARILPPLVNSIPEARLNLVVFHLRQNNFDEAEELLKDLTPTQPQEYILKAVVAAGLAQRPGHPLAREHMQTAQQYYNLVGASASECDTIPGRQCMASCYYLLKNFDDVNIYLQSIKTYLYSDDDFNWNASLALAAAGKYAEAEEGLLLVQNPALTTSLTYLCWLARCYIMNKKARSAWELYLKQETSTEYVKLLRVIANDCYKTGAFYYAAKAFDVLERLDNDPEDWEGKRGACVGVFQAVIAGTENRETLRDVMSILRSTNNPQVEYVLRTINRWITATGGL